jgi:tetratricopeptide (TPR) repeat protein
VSCAAMRFAAGFAVGAFLALAPAAARAQAVRGRVLEGMSVRARGSQTEVTIHFSVPIRVLRHTPQERGDFVQVSVQPLQVGSADQGAFLRSESLATPRNDAVPLAQVEYRGAEPGAPVLELRFTRELRFEVRTGEDFRSVVVVLSGEGGGRYAVQIGSPPEEGNLPPLPDLPALRGRRVYIASIRQGDTTWRRLRLGFYDERSEAEAAAAQLQTAFPGAFAVEVSQREMRMSEATALPAPAPPEPAAAPRQAPDRITDLMDEANRAMTGGEYAKAILIYTEVLSLPENEHSPEAQELLGLARERSDQLAHAKAEYEEYLRRYPNGEAADRVRQRLAALLTARSPGRESLPEPEPERASRPLFDGFGSLYASYRRESIQLQQDNQTSDVLSDSSLFTDLYLETRASGERYTARTQLSGGYYEDLLGSGQSGMHLSSAFLEGAALPWGLTASIGRRSLSTSGVLGRYDGGRIAKRVGDNWEAAVVSGFPVSSPSQDSIDTDRYFVGGSVERERIFGVLDASVFAMHQMVGGSIDRSAIGTELRYLDGGRSVFAYLDYDVYFNSLNIAQLSANAQVSERANLHLLADYRNAPILTTTNALQGQFASSVGELENQLSKSDIQKLAEDRTAKSLFLNAGGSFNLLGNLQLAADASAMHISGTPPSGGVPGFDGTGFEYTYSTQLIANTLMRTGDVEILGLRYLDGSAFDAATLTLSTRQPFTEFLRLEPRVLTEYRFQKNEFPNELLVRPGLGIDYRRWKLDFNVEGGAEWVQTYGNSSAGDQLGWYGLVGIRLDY